MRDEEMVLRFFAVNASLPNYRPPIAQLLNEFMREKRTQNPSDADLRLFKSTMKAIAEVFGGTGFRMMRDDKVTANVNRALFDAVAISFGFANRSQLLKKAGMVKRGHIELLNDADFALLVGRATADRSRMLGRIRMYTNMLKGRRRRDRPSGFAGGLMSKGLLDLSSRLDECPVTHIVDPSRVGDVTQPSRSNALTRDAFLLLSSHLKGYLEDLVTESLDLMVHHATLVEDLPLLLRAIHVEEHLKKSRQCRT